jgi:hypothetical protein
MKRILECHKTGQNQWDQSSQGEKNVTADTWWESSVYQDTSKSYEILLSHPTTSYEVSTKGGVSLIWVPENSKCSKIQHFLILFIYFLVYKLKAND